VTCGTLPVVTEANVDGEKNGSEDDAERGQHTHDDVDDDVIMTSW